MDVLLVMHNYLYLRVNIYSKSEVDEFAYQSQSKMVRKNFKNQYNLLKVEVFVVVLFY